jgi:hypothetical protein
MRPTVLVALLLTVTLALPACAQVNDKAIADVKAGKLTEAKASWWGFDATDATACLQAAINSGVPKLTVDNTGKPWIVEPIELASNQEITFEKGVEVVAKKGAFLGTSDSLFRAVNKENIVLRGYGATWRMHRDDYANPPYKKAEWRHSLQLKSCTNVQVLGLHLLESGGDGVYLGTGKQWVTNKDILLKDLICDRQYRQGISVITAENLTIENVIMRDTGGTAPQAGIDFEPNSSEERLVNVVMRNCVSEGNVGWGYVLYLPNLKASSAPVSIRLENCKATNNVGAFCLVTGNTAEAAVKGSMAITDCTFENNKTQGIQLIDVPSTGIRTEFTNCTISENNLGSPLSSTIMLATRQGADQDLGGATFRDCVVRDSLKRVPMGFVDMVGGLKVVDVTGNLIIEQDGQRKDVKLTPEVLREWMPVLSLKSFPKYDMTNKTLVPVTPGADSAKFGMPRLNLRDVARGVLYASAGDTVKLTMRQYQVGRYAVKPAPVVITGPDGKEVHKASLPETSGQDATIEFTPPATGIYRITATADPNQARFMASSHPINLTAEKEPVHFISSVGEVFLYVPAGTTEFGVRVNGEGFAEGVKATLCDPTGKVVEEKDNIAQACVLSATLAQPSTGEIWSLKLAKPSAVTMEDFDVTPLGVPPFLAPSKEAMLKPQ